jgi:hypothetical protein
MALERIAGLHDEHIDKHQYITNLFAIPAILIYVIALRDKRNNFFGGKMSYKQGFISGLLITLIVAALSPVTQWIISTIITPNYFSNVIDYAVSTDYFETREAAEAHFNLSSYIIQSAIGALIMGVLTTAVAAIFLRKS